MTHKHSLLPFRLTTFLSLLSVFVVFFECGNALLANFDEGRLIQAQKSQDPNFSRDSELVIEAITFSLMQPQSKTKLPGPWQPYVEAGYHIFDVNDARIYLYTDNLHSPASFHSVFGKVGIGLPFGIIAETGFSQTVSEHALNAAFVNLSAQVLDFGSLIYTDLVPSLTVSASYLRTFQGLELNAYGAQASIGAYHRQWLSQFGYIFEYDYARLENLQPAVGKNLIRHGLMTSVPLSKALSMKTEVFFPTLSGTIATSYQF